MTTLKVGDKAQANVSGGWRYVTITGKHRRMTLANTRQTFYDLTFDGFGGLTRAVDVHHSHVVKV